ARPHLHSFPPRRSSDLTNPAHRPSSPHPRSVRRMGFVLLLYLVVALLIAAVGRHVGTRVFLLAAVAPVGALIWLATEYAAVVDRSEEHTSELQSRENLV